MARLIQKTGFIGRKSAGGYMKYIATREGVEVLTGKGPATEKQKEMVAKLLKDFPDMRDSFEYEDYKQAPTLHTASALISAALDSHMQNLQSENGYLKYIATRPGAEKHGAHGLFGREENADLNTAIRDLTSHDGNVWTIIYSLHREDAERLGYNSAAAWQKLLVRQQSKFAEAFHVPVSALHWYAAYHDADTHPHIHMMIWTDQETVLKRDAVVKLRSAMTNSIFQAELENLYIRKDAAYKDVTEAARTAMHGLVDRLESIKNPPESIQQKMLELALELRTVGGKKQYGYLKKPLKDKVDSIVDELEKLPEVAAYYDVWNGLRDTLEGYYKNRPRQRNPLSQQKEFRAIKNAIIQEAERLRQQMEQAQRASEPESSQVDTPSDEETSSDTSTNPTLADENTSSVTSHSARLPSEYLLNSTIRLFHQMGQIFRENAAPPSNPMGIRVDSKRRKKLMQKRLAMGHKQDDHEQEQGYGQVI
ncbi:MAG: MobP3 family relaxase [Oscillospiraceae bacterium]